LGITERKQKHKEQIRANILQTAWAIVLQQGWQALSVRNIAEAIEYSVPVIYSHFVSKEDLLKEFYKEGFRLFGEELIKSKQKHRTPEDQLFAMAKAYWDFAFSNKEYYQLMFGVNIECCFKGAITEEKMCIKELMKTAITEVVKEGGATKAVDVPLKATTLWCILHGLVSINFTSRLLKEEGRTELVFDDAIKSFIYSLKL